MDADVAILSATAVTRSRRKGVKFLVLLVLSLDETKEPEISIILTSSHQGGKQRC